MGQHSELQHCAAGTRGHGTTDNTLHWRHGAVSNASATLSTVAVHRAAAADTLALLLLELGTLVLLLLELLQLLLHHAAAATDAARAVVEQQCVALTILACR